MQALGRLAEAEACQRENVAILRRLVEERKREELASLLHIGPQLFHQLRRSRKRPSFP